MGSMILLAWSSSLAQQGSRSSPAVVRNGGDSTQYELLVTDPGFEPWFLQNYSPAADRTNEYYRSKNLVGVANWNDFYHAGRYPQVIDTHIDYWPQVDYGIDLNRKLYYYFRYVRATYKIDLF